MCHRASIRVAPFALLGWFLGLLTAAAPSRKLLWYHVILEQSAPILPTTYVDASGVVDLEDLFHETGIRRRFRGEVIASDTTIHCSLAPEPGGPGLATSFALITLTYLQHRYRRSRRGQTRAAGELLCCATS